MALTGIDPAARTAGDYREIFFAQGQSSGVSAKRKRLIYGNKTSAGDATVDSTIYGPIGNDAEAVQRAGARSELYRAYKTYSAVDSTAEIYLLAVTESAGTAATKTITFAAGNATATTTYDVYFIGEQTSFTVTSGDTAIVQCAAFVAAFNAGGSSLWPATAAQGAPANDHIATVTVANKGPRTDFVLQGLRCVARKSITTTATVSAVSSGTTADDFTTALATAAQGEYYYQINPNYVVTAPTATDNGVGESILMITTQALPINGKGQQMFFGFVGTQAQQTTVAIDSDANNVRAKFVHAKNSDWPPYMLAAYYASVQALEETKHPAASLTGYRQNSTKSQIFSIPDPFTKSDRFTAAEIEADLANGAIPIVFDSSGNASINRSVTSYTERSSGVKDYRASEGHIPSVMDFAWSLIKQRHDEIRQPFVADDPPAGSKPSPNTMYPSTLKSLAKKVIDDLTGPNPLGIYVGPILAPDKAQVMKDSIVVTKVPGGLNFSANLFAIEHYNKSAWTLNETGSSY